MRVCDPTIVRGHLNAEDAEVLQRSAEKSLPLGISANTSASSAFKKSLAQAHVETNSAFLGQAFATNNQLRAVKKTDW